MTRPEKTGSPSVSLTKAEKRIVKALMQETGRVGDVPHCTEARAKSALRSTYSIMEKTRKEGFCRSLTLKEILSPNFAVFDKFMVSQNRKDADGEDIDYNARKLILELMLRPDEGEYALVHRVWRNELGIPKLCVVQICRAQDG